MSKTAKTIFKILGVIIVVYCAIITTFILSKNKYGFPTFGDNTLVVMDKARKESLKECKLNSLLVISNKKNYKKGQKIYYYVPKESEYIIKTAKIERMDKKNVYIKGDNSETQIPFEKIAGKKVQEHKNVGKLLGLVSSQTGFFLLVIAPTIIVFIVLVRELVALLKENETE